MGNSRHGEQLRVLQRVFERSGVATESAWLTYFSLGGSVGPIELEAHLAGLLAVPAAEGDLIAQAVNELLDKQGWPERVPYSRPVRPPRPQHGPLAAVVDALQGMHLAPPDRLPKVAADAGAALGATIAVYIVDYEQQRLHGLREAHGGDRESLSVESTLAGRAFRQLEVLGSRVDGTATLWVPLLDGVERLGVLEVVPADADDADDPVFRSQLTWLATLLGHLITLTTKYGDGLDKIRRTQPRNIAAELVWQLLPPTTAGTDRVAVAAMVEPCYDVGGDAFDYSLSETTAHLAIFDATGHSLDSGLVTAMAISAYRASRRDGGSLFDLAMSVDAVVGHELERTGRLVTAVLAELDLVSGRLRYISAGHPYPLLLRGGKVVKALKDGRRPMFGIPAKALTVGEEWLERGDWLILYTDGITEARDEDGSFFGIDRLEDFLEREVASGHPPPEMVRRLVRAVLAYQKGVLQDDATVLVARWGDFSWDLRL